MIVEFCAVDIEINWVIAQRENVLCTFPVSEY